MDNFKKYVIDNNLGEIIETASFKDLTSIRVGGNIKILYIPNNIDSLSLAFKYINLYDLKYFILGSGTNILHVGDIYDGIVITLKSIEKRTVFNDRKLVVSSNFLLPKLIKTLSSYKIGDLSLLAGIPGCVGGAIYGNAGAENYTIASDLISIKYMDSFGKIHDIKKDDCLFGYRYSIFKELKCIIIEATFKIIHNVDTLDLVKSRIYIKKKRQPQGYPCFGSTFKNLRDIKAYEVIKKLNLDNLEVGGAKISEKHANFIINYNNATSSDIIKIIEKIKKEAKETLNYELEEEIIIFN